MEPIEALVFDAYGTLFDVHSVIALCNELFPGKGAALSERWRSKQLEYTWLRSLMGMYEDFWHVTESALLYACNTLDVKCDAANRERLMNEYLRLAPFPDVLPTLRTLYGRPMAILSNGSPVMLAAATQSSRIDEVLSAIISVDEVKTYKPSPAVYELACEKLRTKAPNIGFVSSNCWDVIGAKAFGFQTFWINRANQPLDLLGLAPDTLLNSLSDLPSRLTVRPSAC
jgi:2-haloacid dehalogenase